MGRGGERYFWDGRDSKKKKKDVRGGRKSVDRAEIELSAT